MTSNRRALIVFMRHPKPGEVKSRLAADLGKEEASRIYESLLRRTLGVVADFKRENPEVGVFLFFTPMERETQIKASFPGPWRFHPQEGDHLGERMERAILDVLARGYGSVLLVGSDIADHDGSDFSEAFQALDRGNAVLGPANDGGFYLIGLNRPCPSAFKPSEWGTEVVMRRTELLLNGAEFKVSRLKTRMDIDRPDEVSLLSDRPFFQDRLSIIIPTLGPLERIRPRLSFLERQLWPDDEIIVVQGGGHVGEKASETTARIRFVASSRGRGLQLNAGTEAARGNLLLFLHDDSIPPPNFAYSVRKISRASRASIGCFQLEFHPSTRSLSMIAAWANFRTRHFKLPYGDQGIFCRREIVDKVGGFRRLYLMEDVDFIKRCKGIGKLMILHEKISTSSERYQRKGILRASLQNHMTMLLYLLGVNDKKLYSLYYGS